MPWPPTSEQFEKIPQVYRDFMLVLSAQNEMMKGGRRESPANVTMNRIALGKVFNALRFRYQYEPQQIVALAENLQSAGYISFVSETDVAPTPRGEELADAILLDREARLTVPPLPEL